MELFDLLSMGLALSGVAFVLLLAEFLWRGARPKQAEQTRKLVHIVVGVYIAFWPKFLTLPQIQLLSIVLGAVVFFSKKVGMFHSIYSVNRSTYGELLFPVGVFVAATFASSGWIYFAALLHLSLADGLAALIGTRYLKRFRYTIIGNTKTLIGTAVFYATSIGILAGSMMGDPAAYGQSALYILLLLPILVTIVENVSPKGTDNILVPLVVVVVLNMSRTMV